jgi:hypothetical protein
MTNFIGEIIIMSEPRNVRPRYDGSKVTKEVRSLPSFHSAKDLLTLTIYEAQLVVGMYRDLIATYSEPESDKKGKQELDLILRLAKAYGESKEQLVGSVQFARRIQGLPR